MDLVNTDLLRVSSLRGLKISGQAHKSKATIPQDLRLCSEADGWGHGPDASSSACSVRLWHAGSAQAVTVEMTMQTLESGALAWKPVASMQEVAEPELV